MAVTQVIGALPSPPHRGVDSSTVFVGKAEALFDTLQATTVTELNTAFGQLNTLETNVNAKELSATNAASTATTKAGEAIASANNASASEIAAAASAASAAALAGAFVGTSTTSLVIGTGNKTFTTQTGEQYTATTWLSAVSASSPTNWMIGQVVSYTGSVLVVNVTNTNGTGTFADWNISLTGTPGAQGPQGLAGTVPESKLYFYGGF